MARQPVAIPCCFALYMSSTEEEEMPVFYIQKHQNKRVMYGGDTNGV